MKVEHWRALAAAVVFLCPSIIACTKDRKCVTGESVACACPTGAAGAQICAESGTFEPCVCAPSAAQPPQPAAAPQPDLGSQALPDAGAVQEQQPATAATGQKEPNKKPPESWYRRCVRQGIQDHIRQYGSRANLKGAEETAIFACQATMGCSGQRDCDAKAARSAKAERDALGKWK